MPGPSKRNTPKKELGRQRRVRPNPRGVLVLPEVIRVFVRLMPPSNIRDNAVLRDNIDWVIAHGEVRMNDFDNGLERQVHILQQHFAEQEAARIQLRRRDREEFERYQEERRLRLEAEAKEEEDKEENNNQ